MIAPSLMDPSSHIIYYNLTEDTRTKKYDFQFVNFVQPVLDLVTLTTLTNRYNITKKHLNWFLNYVLKNRETIVNIPFPPYR